MKFNNSNVFVVVVVDVVVVVVVVVDVVVVVVVVVIICVVAVVVVVAVAIANGGAAWCSEARRGAVAPAVIYKYPLLYITIPAVIISSARCYLLLSHNSAKLCFNSAAVIRALI